MASCVMTFEARDSAAKVVPARFKISNGARTRSGGTGSRRTTSKQIFRKTKPNFFQIFLNSLSMVIFYVFSPSVKPFRMVSSAITFTF